LTIIILYITDVIFRSGT